jgi:hypothetical protein
MEWVEAALGVATMVPPRAGAEANQLGEQLQGRCQGAAYRYCPYQGATYSKACSLASEFSG